MINALSLMIMRIFTLASEFTFTPEGFVDSLKYMGVGMLGIFLVIAIIIFSVYALNLFTLLAVRKKSDKKKKD